jgi:hypothetical protein
MAQARGSRQATVLVLATAAITVMTPFEWAAQLPLDALRPLTSAYLLLAVLVIVHGGHPTLLDDMARRAGTVA